MEFDGLRLILLLIGIAVVATVYFWDRLPWGGRGAGQEMRPRREPAMGDDPEVDSEPFELPPAVRQPEIASAEPAHDESIPVLYDEIYRPPEPGTPSDVIVVHVFASRGNQFQGAELGAALEEVGMGYGAMRIYHRMDEAGDRLFSLANTVEPGQFDPERMADLQTPGVALFLALPGPQRPAATLEEMLATADTLTRRLDGRLLDADRNPLRPQGMEHLRERVREFERRSRIARARS